jgi:hypothetical protein
MSDDAAEPVTANWTVKNMPVEDRRAAITAAHRQGLPVHAWLSRAVRTQIEVDRGNQVIPPAFTPGVNGHAHAPAQALVPYQPPEDLITLEHMAAVAQAVSHAAGKPLPRYVSRAMYKLLLARLGV